MAGYVQALQIGITLQLQTAGITGLETVEKLHRLDGDDGVITILAANMRKDPLHEQCPGDDRLPGEMRRKTGMLFGYGKGERDHVSFFSIAVVVKKWTVFPYRFAVARRPFLADEARIRDRRVAPAQPE